MFPGFDLFGDCIGSFGVRSGFETLKVPGFEGSRVWKRRDRERSPCIAMFGSKVFAEIPRSVEMLNPNLTRFVSACYLHPQDSSCGSLVLIGFGLKMSWYPKCLWLSHWNWSSQRSWILSLACSWCWNWKGEVEECGGNGEGVWVVFLEHVREYEISFSQKHSFDCLYLTIVIKRLFFVYFRFITEIYIFIYILEICEIYSVFYFLNFSLIWILFSYLYIYIHLRVFIANLWKMKLFHISDTYVI